MSEDLEWRKAVRDMLLNRARKKQVDVVIRDLFLDYPSPEALADAREDDLRDLLYPLGMSRTRARRLIELSSKWANEG